MGADHPRNTTLGSGRWLRVKNASGEDMPPFAVCWIDGLTTTAAGVAILQAKKPDGDDGHTYYVAGPGGIVSGGVGFVTGDWPEYAAYDASAAAPSRDDEIGPASGNWRMVAAGTGFKALSTGAAGVVFVRHTAAATGLETRFAEFTLTAALTSGSATATVNSFWGGADPGGTITVVDLNTQFKRAVTGCQGLATYDDDNSRWVVIECQTTVLEGHATLTGALTTSESAKVVTIVRTWNGYPVTGNVTAYNLPDPIGPGAYLFEGISGSLCRISYDPENDKWWMDWVQCGPEAAATPSMAVKGKPPQPSVAAMNSEAIFDLT